MPKHQHLKDFPEVQKKWDCCGVPEILLWDNAMHFHSNHLQTAGLQLGCDIQYGPKNMPWYRALIEEFLGFVNRSCLQSLPGTTFSNVLRRGDYNPVKNGVIRRSTFRRILMIWTVDFYMQSPRHGMEDIPACRWRDYFGDFPPELPNDLDFLNTALGEHTSRTAFHYGIDLFHLRYNNQHLGEVRKRFGTGKSKSVDVEVNYDRGNIGSIYVLDPGNGKYFRVEAANYNEYAKDLSLWQHRVIRKWKLKKSA